MRHTRAILFSIALATLLASIQAARAQSQTLDLDTSLVVSSEILEVDSATRVVTLKRRDGTITTHKVGPEIRNFDRIDAGDTFNVEFSAIQLVELHKSVQVQDKWAETQQSERSELGEKPGATLVRKVAFSATVESINPESGSIVLRGSKGSIKPTVAPGIALEGFLIGERVEGVYRQRIFVWVTGN